MLIVSLMAASCGGDGAPLEVTSEAVADQTATSDGQAGDSQTNDGADAGTASSDTGVGAASDAAAGEGPVRVRATSDGNVLETADGHTLYGNVADVVQGTPTCPASSADCSKWLPLMQESDQLPAGLDPGDFSLVAIPGGFQVTYSRAVAQGLPLYTYADDDPGQYGGQGDGLSWYVVSEGGKLANDFDVDSEVLAGGASPQSVEADSTRADTEQAAATGTVGVLADSSTLGGETGVYSNVAVKVVEVRTSLVGPLQFNDDRPDEGPTGDDQYVYVKLDFESLDPNDWFDFSIDMVKLSVDGRLVPSEFTNPPHSYRSEPRTAVAYWYGFRHDGPLDLASSAIVIDEGTVPLTLPLDGSAAPAPYPVQFDPPDSIAYVDGAFHQDCAGVENQLTFTELIVDLQEPAEWQVSVFGGQKRAATGQRLLILKGFGDRVQSEFDCLTPSDIDGDGFRLLVDGRPSQPVGGEVVNSRGLVGDVTDFELLWPIPADADSLVLQLTGSTGDSAEVEVPVGDRPTVAGE